MIKDLSFHNDQQPMSSQHLILDQVQDQSVDSVENRGRAQKMRSQNDFKRLIKTRSETEKIELIFKSHFGLLRTVIL